MGSFGISFIAGLAVFVIEIILMAKGIIKPKGLRLKEKAIENGCVTQGKLVKEKEYYVRADENHRSSRAEYKGKYKYTVDGKEYFASFAYATVLKPEITIYYRKGSKRAINPNKSGFIIPFVILFPIFVFIMVGSIIQ